MPKPKRIDRPVLKNISLPQSVVVPVELELFSELEGRVPHGAWSRLVESLLRDYLTRTRPAAAP